LTEGASMARTHGRVLSGTGGVWRVRTDAGETREASMRGRLKKDEGRRSDNEQARPMKLAVGDDVILEEGERGGAWAIAEILPRRSRLARKAPTGAPTERIVAANVDQVVVVFAAANPEPHSRMLDRFLAIAEANELPARVVVNKVELVGEDAVRKRWHDYERAGYPLHLTSVKQGLGLDALHDALAGRTSVLSGPSGVGKSSLINSMYPGLNLRVGEISQSVNKGRHTTVGASMHPLSLGPGPATGYVVDSPGLREVGMWGLPSRSLDACFPEFRPYLGQCRFGDCSHGIEPECAIREAVDRGDVSRERYESFLKLREELEKGENVY
jgi:ribosome biogenesis GTPase / thiamine phosphate phosphatase